MDNRTTRDSSGEDPEDSSALRTNQWTSSISSSFLRLGESITSVLTNLNLVGSLAVLAALVSFWLNFRGAYAATKSAVNELSPIAASLLLPILVGLTVFVIVWCTAYGWRYVQSMTEKSVPYLKAKRDLKKLAPDIESCLFFLEEAIHAEDEMKKHRLRGYIGEICLSLWEEMVHTELDGPTAYCIQDALARIHRRSGE